MKRSLILLIGLAVGLVLPQASRAALALCQPDQLSLGFDSEDGNFDGMSHSGTLLVLRNLGPAPCRLPAFPKLEFADQDGKILNITAKPQGDGPAPGLAAGAEATVALRWVSGQVFTDGVCRKTARLVISWPGGQRGAALAVCICGPGGKPASVLQAPLATDPVLGG